MDCEPGDSTAPFACWNLRCHVKSSLGSIAAGHAVFPAANAVRLVS